MGYSPTLGWSYRRMSDVIQVPQGFTPRPYQLKLFQALDGIAGRPETRTRRAFLRWHRRCGKDMACLAYMFKEAARRMGIYYYFFPSYRQGRKVIWEGTNKEGTLKLLDMMPKELIKRVNNQEMLFELTNGSVFRVIGTDDIDSIVGTNPIGCVFSEYSLQNPEAWTYIRPILVENGGWAIFNGTPRGKNHMYDLDNLVKYNSKWYYSVLQTMWPDQEDFSGLVSQEALEEELNTGMDYETLCQEYGVSYSAGVKGSYYAEVIRKAKDEGRIGEYVYNPNLWVDTFWDLGLRDSTCIWFRQVSGNTITWIDFVELEDKSVPQIVQELEKKGYRYRTHYLPWDGDNRSSHTKLTTRDVLADCCREVGISDDVTCVERTRVILGIQAVRARFYRFRFDANNCADGLTKLELYHKKYDSRRQVFLDEPHHDWCSHAADALRTEAIAEELNHSGGDGVSNRNIRLVSDFNVFK